MEGKESLCMMAIEKEAAKQEGSKKERHAGEQSMMLGAANSRKDLNAVQGLMWPKTEGRGQDHRDRAREQKALENNNQALYIDRPTPQLRAYCAEKVHAHIAETN
jgi:hypothetical protein